MEGSHQKGKNWYRCRFVYQRGAIAADAAGHLARSASRRRSSSMRCSTS
jgi:hypothetical protein